MFQTTIGAFSGKSWEDLFQQVLKLKYSSLGYQPIPASPGDFGLEGFTLDGGMGFQCYCPDKHYTTSELYELQRDKITEDVGKLRAYETDLLDRIGEGQIREWIFITPRIDNNRLLKHARRKEKEARSWGLKLLAPEFRIVLHDGEHYLKEINAVRSTTGQQILIGGMAPVLASSPNPEEYDANIQRKTERRLAEKSGNPRFEELCGVLAARTREQFLQTDSMLREIADVAPTVHFGLLRIIVDFENEVIEKSMTWTGSAEALTEHVTVGLASRICADIGDRIGSAHAQKIARHVVARWIALCELDYV